MGTIDWDAFLKGWQGHPPTSSTSSSESKLLASTVKNVGSNLTKQVLELIGLSAGIAAESVVGHSLACIESLIKDADEINVVSLSDLETALLSDSEDVSFCDIEIVPRSPRDCSHKEKYDKLRAWN